MGPGVRRGRLRAISGGGRAVAGRTGRPGKPVIACVVYDEGDGRAQFARWDDVLTTVGFCEPVPVLVSQDAPLDVQALGNADGLLVCGGLTPGYAAAVAPAAVDVLDWLLLGDRPYAGFSAGSAIAAADALVGGWQSGGVPICPEDAAEDLDRDHHSRGRRRGAVRRRRALRAVGHAAAADHRRPRGTRRALASGSGSTRTPC